MELKASSQLHPEKHLLSLQPGNNGDKNRKKSEDNHKPKDLPVSFVAQRFFIVAKMKMELKGLWPHTDMQCFQKQQSSGLVLSERRFDLSSAVCSV